MTPEFEDAVKVGVTHLREKLGYRGQCAVTVYETGVAPADRVFRGMARVPLPKIDGHARLGVGPTAELREALVRDGGSAGKRAAWLLSAPGPPLYLVGLMAAGIQAAARWDRGTVVSGVFSWDDGSFTPARPSDAFLGRSSWGTVTLADGTGFTVEAEDPRTAALARMLAQAAVAWPRRIAEQPVWDDCPFSRRLSADDFAGAVATHYGQRPEAVAIALYGLRGHAPEAAGFLYDVLGRWRLMPLRVAADALLEGL